ncbi:MAG: hypothetical protein H7Y38_13660 [Armatimonadetes bacterium]|nr:hypothetical protein [Armatimonadota bacterium]
MIVFVVVFCAAVAGCDTSPAPSVTTSPIQNAAVQAYADANKSVMTSFGAKLKEIAARPVIKPAKTLPKRERREVLAKQLDAETQAAQIALTRLQELTPPPTMRTIHEASCKVLQTFHDGSTATVAAIRLGDRAGVKAASQKQDADTRAAFAELRAVLQVELIKEGKTPAEAEAMTANISL